MLFGRSADEKDTAKVALCLVGQMTIRPDQSKLELPLAEPLVVNVRRIGEWPLPHRKPPPSPD